MMTRRLWLAMNFLAAFTLCGIPLAPAARAADTWTEVQSPHLTVAGNVNEKELRKVCDQFELFRAVFHNAFPGLRVDMGKPIIILAAKNEGTMKEYLPEEYAVKGHVHSVGRYQIGMDKHYVILRMDQEEDSAYHTLYHEYTHALMHLNFGRIPLWLDEGLAEYLGNARLGNKEARIGLIDPSHLYILQQNKLLPIETLFSVDHNSPHYNEANRASVFYAESWALVHYLMLDQNARQQKLMNKFVDAYAKSGDQIEAARETFGDLKKFGQLIETYARQGNFYNGVLKPPTDAMDKNYSARALSAGEVLALKGDFFVHGNRTQEAKAILDEALKQEPKLALAHEALGMCDYHLQDFGAADREMQRAMELGSNNFLPYYMHGFLELRGGYADEERARGAAESLTKALKMNPDFAPAYDALASALGRPGQDQTKAINAAIQATKLEPANLAYSIHLTYLLLNANREAEAKTMVNRIQSAASTPQEKMMANQMMQAIEARANWQETAGGQNRDRSDASGESGAPATVTIAPNEAKDSKSSAANGGTLLIEKSLRPVDGEITAAACPKEGQIILTLKLSDGIMTLHTEDLDEVELVDSQGKPAPEPDSCSAWKGRQVRVWIAATQGKVYVGEIKKISFF